jgi:hypothetical protein
MREYVENGLRAVTLQPSTSPFGSMALIVKKKVSSPAVQLVPAARHRQHR